MLPKILLVNVEYSQIVVADVHDAHLSDLQFENCLELHAVVGDVICGRVQNVVRGLDAAFVDIGTERTAFLPLEDTINKVQSGQFLLLQVAKPAVDEKGARLTTQISLPGRFAVLTNEAGVIGISQKIKSKSERERLHQAAQKYLPACGGIVMRTEAQNAQDEEIANDIMLLEQCMQSIEADFSQSKIGVLHRENGLINRIARDINSETSRIIIDAPHEYSMLRELLQHSPQLAERVELHDDARWIFDVFGVADDYRATQERVVKLRSGGNIVFDETEALTAIDVNTAQFVGKKQLSQTVLQTNIEAAQEIALQLRLRNIGGVIVIDFIDLQNEKTRAQVLNVLAEKLKTDRAKTRIVHFSSLNLLQMTRERRGQSLRQMLREKCACCDGDGLISTVSARATDAHRALKNAIVRRHDAAKFRIHIPASIIEAFFGNDFEAIRVLETRWKIEVYAAIADDSCEIKVEVLSADIFNCTALNQQFAANSQDVLKTKLGDFLVRDRVLVRLQNAFNVAPNTTLWCEITAHGRWFCEGRVVLTGEAKIS